MSVLPFELHCKEIVLSIYLNIVCPDQPSHQDSMIFLEPSNFTSRSSIGQPSSGYTDEQTYSNISCLNIRQGPLLSTTCIALHAG